MIFILITIGSYSAYADTCHTVTYIANGGISATGDSVIVRQTNEPGSLTAAPYNLFSKDGYTLLYWLGSDGSTYIPGESCISDDDITMTAQWGYGHITYIVTNPSSGENLNTHIQYIDVNGEEIKATSELLYENYGFCGWNTEPDGSGTYYPVGAVISENIGRLVLYSIWCQCPDEYVAYSANGSNIFGGISYSFEPTDSFPKEITLPAKYNSSSHIYIGWSENFHGEKSRIYLPGEKLVITESTVFSLVYTSKERDYEYTQAIYNGNGGADISGAKVLTTLASNGDLVLYGDDIFIRDGYDFAGWSTTPDGSADSYLPGETLDDHLCADLHLYAQWQKRTAAVKGSITSCFSLEGYVMVNIKTDYIYKNCNAIMALYDTTGKLCGISKSDVNATDQYIGLSCPCSEDGSEYIVKILFLGTEGAINPLGKAIEAPVGSINAESAHPYKNNTDETFVYTYPGECSSISVTFSENTETENGYDYITIKDAADNTTGTYTGTELSGQTVTITGNKVKICLKSDSTLSSYGYKLESININK